MNISLSFPLGAWHAPVATQRVPSSLMRLAANSVPLMPRR